MYGIDSQQTPRLSLVLATLLFLVISFSIFIIIRHRRLLYIIIKTVRRDCSGITRFIRTNRELRHYQKLEHSVGHVFDQTVARHAGKVCFQFEDQTWSFQEVRSLSNKVANYFYRQGYRKGDVVALFMENRPEYVCMWLGLSKIGVVTSLINTNLRQVPLRHSFEVSKTKAIIFGTELAPAVAEALEENLKSGATLPLFSIGSVKAHETGVVRGSLGNRSKCLEQCLQEELDSVPDCKIDTKFSDDIFYIFTSGTTGLPKATVIKHSRFMMGSISFHHINDLKSNDVMYTCLPLYHSAGGICGVSRALFYGNTVILRKKFSASKFWKDCSDHKVTVAQYIGDICRYLLQQPYTPEEKQHKIRVMIGNGLRTEIWQEFISRFNIKQISELYGSTDGNCTMFNFDNRPGAVGFVPVLLHNISPIGLIRVDEATGEPRRNPKTGLAIRCKPGEPGEAVGKIIKNNPVRDFPGYAGNNAESRKKILNDVFRKGDIYFRSGDILVQDEYGYFYFMDRSGDTFRWKGENVSTTEVEAVISSITGLKDCVVFGVKIPGTEGSAGMVTIADPEKSLDLQQLTATINNSLPAYARPLFVRVSKEIEMTGTHKLKKMDLQRQGFCKTSIEDPLFFFLDGKYVELTVDLYNLIMKGEVRL